MKIVPKVYQSTNAPESIREAVRPYEIKFGVKFSSLYVFTKQLLNQIQLNSEIIKRNGKLLIASDKDCNIKNYFSILTKVANSPILDINLSKEYYDALIEIYSRLPKLPLSGKNIIMVAPEREGKMLAQRMGWYVGNSFGPCLKRIHYKSGLIVGINKFEINGSFKECNIIDGAIASGATIITLMCHLKGIVKKINIFSIHAALQGIISILKVAEYLNIDLTIIVGDTSNGLNKKFYATFEEQPNKLQIGDIGDTIDILQNKILSKA